MSGSPKCRSCWQPTDTCDTCKGVGKIPFAFGHCTACDGTGWVCENHGKYWK